MYQTMPRVLEHEKISEGYFRLSLESPEVAENAVPGQFVMVKVGGTNDPLLRRPFSIHRIQDSGIEILYKVIGKGTGMMAHIKTGEEIDIIGPLGRGFTFESDLKEAIIVGGGIGAAPMLALAEELGKKGKKVVVFLGGRSKNDILCKEEFKKLGAEVHAATDDGSDEYAGFVTGLLDNYIKYPSTFPSAITIAQQRMEEGNVVKIFSCGPHLMSKKVAEISYNLNIPCQVSLEAHMACGVGACLGCVIKTKGTVLTPPPFFDKEGGRKAGELSSCGCDSNFVPCSTQVSETSYQRVCMEGPVFDAEEVVWD